VVEPCFFAMPQSEPRRLKVKPLTAGHPDEQRLRAYLRYVTDLTTGPIGESALRLDLGPSPGALVNYLIPVATRLLSAGRQLTSCWVTRSDRFPSLLRVDTACPVDVEVHAEAQVSTKDQIREVAAGLPVAEPVGLEIAFVVGPRRNWLNLWKPTMDALGNPQIVRLGLHNRVDPHLGNQVRIAIRLDTTAFRRDDQFVYRAGGPIDEVFDRVLAHREVAIERLEVERPADDDSLWYFIDPVTGRRPVQIECGRDGQPPFHVEGDHPDQCLGTADPIEAAEAVLKWL